MEHPFGLEGVQRITVLDLPVDDLPEDQISDALLSMLRDHKTHQVVLMNLWDLMRARRDSEFRSLVARASLVIPTTAGVVRGAHFLHQVRPTRYTAFDFIVRLLGALEELNGTLYIIGGHRAELRVVEDNFRQTFPGVRLVGRYAGEYPKAMEQSIVTAVRKAAPNVLFAGPRLPGQEKWIFRRRESFAPGVFVYSDDCFDVFAERRRRPTRSSFRQGLSRAIGTFWRPWRLIALPIYLWFWIRLLFRRLSRR